MTSSGSRSRAPIGLFLIAVLFWPGGPARADEFQRHYQRASILYRQKHYEEAITELKAAYALKPRSRLLLNIGHAYLDLGQPDDALHYYRRYQEVEPVLRPADRAQLDTYLTQAQKALEQQEEQRRQTERPPPPSVTTQPPAPAPVLAPIVERAPPSRPAPPRGSSAGRPGLRAAGWVVGGAGLLLTAAGAVLLGLDGLQSCDRVLDQRQCPQVLSSRDAGIGLLTAGLVALPVASLMVGLGYRKTWEKP